MAKTTFTLPDGSISSDGFLGDFHRDPCVFSVHQTSREPGEYQVECYDGSGTDEVCRIVDAPGSRPLWLGAWNDDQWCDWIEAEARKLIAKPDRG